jgi:hypothetical protein
MATAMAVPYEAEGMGKANSPFSRSALRNVCKGQKFFKINHRIAELTIYVLQPTADRGSPMQARDYA